MGFSPLPWTIGRASATLIVLALGLAFPALAQSFPPLTGRVVDAAGIIPEGRRGAIEAKLKAHEDRTSDQVVVATIPSLGGTSIEDYANRLYRHWQLGQKAKNNGALLVVAPSERKMRIEVGYGLEGALTDALSKVIISTAIAPRFKAGDFPGGVEAGVDAILAILTGDAEEWQRRAPVRTDERSGEDSMLAVVVFVVIIFLLVIRLMRNRSGPVRMHRRRNGSWIPVPVPYDSGSWGGSWGGGSGSWGGGFSGGGGSSGGGGASGGW